MPSRRRHLTAGNILAGIAVSTTETIAKAAANQFSVTEFCA
jgi:hypothetical protein